MTLNHHEKMPLFKRYADNPILTSDMWPYPANTVFNPGATTLPDGTTLLLCRVEDMRSHSHLTVARSKDGITNWQIDPRPTLLPDIENYPEEMWGIEDPRITFVPEMQQYAILYTSYSRSGPGVSMALTKDFRTFERLGVVMSPEDKDAALFPRRIKGEWALIHRPVGSFGAHMWISYTTDLKYWGGHKMMLEARRGAWWDARKIGLCNPPIETPRGWLTIYHGVRETAAGSLYRLGLALFDLESPEICLIRGDEWVFGADEPYERFGDVGNVVFPCGHVIEPDGDTMRIYYGAADHCIALATTRISMLLDWLDEHGRAYIARHPSDEAQGPYRSHDRRL